ncbi:Dihydrofolate reductase [Amphibacillus marinus]|uniref:Dihydrofolate reductase n=1 Tax=Amphibacillus marinus TaxID=872970 RepID=A0A1H8KAT3_9BACI|nr:dihydrofolate reductase family protein [Amphibacillus marinus]SEN90122.1 Dihydrofolate reductase [Amphibacillus marinus]
MRRVIYSQMVSLDGFIEGPVGEIDWGVPDDQLFAFINQQELTVDTHLYGRRTYQNMASYWPEQEHNPSASASEQAFSRQWQQVKKLVFSTTLTEVSWNSKLVSHSIKQAVQHEKMMPGGDLLLGGAGVAGSFMENDLIDCYHLYVHPVILGSGKRFFPNIPELKQLNLVDHKAFQSGVVFLGYQRADVNG